MNESKFLSLNTRDWLRGLVMAVGTPVIGYVLESLNKGSWDINWKQAGILALSATCMYLLKNFFTPKTTKNETPNI